MYRGNHGRKVNMKRHAFPISEWEDYFLKNENDRANFEGYCDAMDLTELNPKEFFNIAWILSLDIRKENK